MPFLEPDLSPERGSNFVVRRRGPISVFIIWCCSLITVQRRTRSTVPVTRSLNRIFPFPNISPSRPYLRARITPNVAHPLSVPVSSSPDLAAVKPMDVHVDSCASRLA